MKLRILSVALLSGLLALPVMFAQEGGKKKESKEAETELGGKMEKIGGAYRKLGRQINDASKNADSLALVAVIKQNATAALKLEPVKKKDIPAADQEKFVADYRSEMKVFLGLVDKLEAALKANDNAAAAKLVDELKDERNENHKKFEKEKKKQEKKG